MYVHLRMTAGLCFCAIEDIPSDAEAEARLQNVENPEPLPIDIRKPHNLEQATRIGTVCCNLKQYAILFDVDINMFILYQVLYLVLYVSVISINS